MTEKVRQIVHLSVEYDDYIRLCKLIENDEQNRAKSRDRQRLKRGTTEVTHHLHKPKIVLNVIDTKIILPSTDVKIETLVM